MLLQACSDKGCTDKNALNYNVVANKDDGSCEFCDSTYTLIGQDSIFLIDEHSSSSHYQEVVAKFVVTQRTLKHNYSTCGDDKCTVTYTVENLCNQDFDLNYNLQYGGSNIFINTDNFITVMANHTNNTIEVPQSAFFSDPCELLFPGIGNVSLNTPIIYH